jgi:hypothetical protein
MACCRGRDGAQLRHDVLVLNHMFKNAWDINKGTNLWERMAETANPTVQFDMKNADGTSTLNPATRELMDHLQWSGLINFGQMQQIWRPHDAAEAPVRGVSTATGKVGRSEPHRVGDPALHRDEQPHRRRARGARTGAHQGREDKAERNAMMEAPRLSSARRPRKYAMQMIRNTDGDHSQGNIARALGRRGFAKGATPLVVGFNQYDFQMTESLVRLALSAVKGPEKGAVAGEAALARGSLRSHDRRDGRRARHAVHGHVLRAVQPHRLARCRQPAGHAARLREGHARLH